MNVFYAFIMILLSVEVKKSKKKSGAHRRYRATILTLYLARIMIKAAIWELGADGSHRCKTQLFIL